MTRSPRACAFGEEAIYVDVGEVVADERAGRTLAAAAALRECFAAAEVVVGAGAVAVHGVAPTAPALGAAIRAVRRVRQDEIEPGGGRRHEVRVVYDGVDLDDVATQVGMSRAQVVELHTGREYLVELVGFLPGFGYLGPLDARLQLPRRRAPRPSVPARSVAIAGAFTGIYPAVSPGGWHLLGQAVDFVAFDPRRAEPSLLSPGDRVRFLQAPSDGAAMQAALEASPPPEPSGGTSIAIVAATPGVTVQDRGRRALARGVPPSGPLDPALHGAANAAVGNAAGAAAIEVPLGGLEVVARGDAIVSVDGARATTVADGESLAIAPAAHAVRYLAVRGGLDVPAVLGSRATLVSARLGGLDGRALRPGDRLAIGDAAAYAAGDRASPATASSTAPDAAALELLVGPHVERFPQGALQALLSAAWRVSRLGDRVGVRLEGASVPREGSDSALPAPMVRGAVQVSTDGTPIVLGPDHPVTGGYPVLAVLTRDAQRRFAQLRPGTELRFALSARPVSA